MAVAAFAWGLSDALTGSRRAGLLCLMHPLCACSLQGSSQMAADSAQFASRTAAVEGAAALLNSACWEVQQSELLRTLLRVALLAGEGRQLAGVAPAPPLPSW